MSSDREGTALALEFVRVQAVAAQVARHGLDAAVLAARARGATWVQVADMTGVSRQAARQRWGPLEDQPI